MDVEVNGRKLKNLTKINVLLGKNGTGKSVLLRHFEQHKKNLPDFGTARYITPERGGELVYEGGVETNSLQISTGATMFVAATDTTIYDSLV
jgi:predicted ATPase